jgi:hypothetical protein
MYTYIYDVYIIYTHIYIYIYTCMYIHITHTHAYKCTHVCAEEKGRQREIERGETKDERFGEGGGERERGR